MDLSRQFTTETEFVLTLGAVERRNFLSAQQVLTGEDASKQLPSLSLYQKTWEIRYKYLKKQDRYADTWIEFLQTLIFTSAEPTWGNCRRGNKLLKKTEASWSSEGIFPVLEAELTNLVYLYIHLCSRDHNYGTILFGFGKRKPEAIRKRIRDDLYKVEEVFLRDSELTLADLLSRAIHRAIALYDQENPLTEISL